MKNSYIKTIKLFLKEDKFFVQNKENQIYIFNGYFLVHVPLFDYDRYFRIESGLFPKIEENKTYCVNNKQLEECNTDVFPILEGAEKVMQPVKKLSFSLRFEKHGKEGFSAIYSGENMTTFIDNNFIAICEDTIKTLKLKNTYTMSAGEKKPFMVYDENENLLFLVMPLNIKKEVYANDFDNLKKFFE